MTDRMQHLEGRVAVITGAASGFGRELAILCAERGMKLALADVDSDGLAETVALPEVAAAESISVSVDVARSEDLDKLADATWDAFGAAHLLFNNAGVAVAGPTWSTTLDDWKWVMDVNLMGVVHGIRSFVPRMLAQGSPAHVINTASVAGLTSVPGSSVYCVSKHGVVTLSECLHHDLQLAKADIGVSVLCPAFVQTGIGDSDRNRPSELADKNPMAAPFEQRVKAALAAGRLTATDIAHFTIDSVQRGDFYILTHPKITKTIETRMQDIIEQRIPTNPMP